MNRQPEHGAETVTECPTTNLGRAVERAVRAKDQRSDGLAAVGAVERCEPGHGAVRGDLKDGTQRERPAASGRAV